MKLALLCLFIFLVVINVSYAANVNVRYEKGIYYFVAEFIVEAAPKRVMQVLTDYENIADFNAAIHTSELLGSPNKNVTRIRTVLRDCILFFCRDIVRVEDVAQYGDEKLEAYLIPMMSDLQSGYAVWTLTENPSGTTVFYEASVQPKFWIPPFVRSVILTKKFKKRVLESVEHLQRAATV